MPKIRPLLPEERMKIEFYARIKGQAERLGLKKEKDIAERIEITPTNYSHRKNSRTLAPWSGDDLARVFKKLKFTQEDILAIFKEGMSV